MAKPRKSVKKETVVEEPTHTVIETFRRPWGYWLRDLAQPAPSCFNGHVEVRRCRVTVELIDEPNEVIGARLQQMWDECDNWHHWGPLKAAAAKVGYTITGNAGSKIKAKT